MRWWPVVLLWGCGGDKDDAPIEPFEDTGDPVTTDTETLTDTGPTTEPTTALCSPLPAPSGAVVSVAANDDLAAAVAAASAGDTLELSAGTYSISPPLHIDKALTLRSATGDASSVTIDGGYAAGHVVEIAASDVTLAHLTIAHAYDDLVHVEPVDSDLSGIRLHDLSLVDPGVRAVRVQGTADGRYFVDGGEVSCSSIQLTDDGREEVRGACDIGGIDLSATRDWTVRDTTIDGLWCDSGLASPGIRATYGVRDVKIWRNVMTDTVQGIVLGEGTALEGRQYDDEPCGDGYPQSIDGEVVNNIVSTYRQLLRESFEGIGTGIRLEQSCNVFAVHNSVYAPVDPAIGRYGIEHRYDLTSGVVANNLTTWTVQRSDGSTATAEGNHELADETVWYFPADGDFHLAPAAGKGIVDAGSTNYLGEVPDDVDGDPRDSAPDVGADERT